jgi:hypothetical protein
MLHPALSRVEVARGMIPSKGGIHAMVPNGAGGKAAPMTNTATMRAIRQDTHGSIEVLEEVEIPGLCQA